MDLDTPTTKTTAQRPTTTTTAEKWPKSGLEKTQRIIGLVSHRAPASLQGLARRVNDMQTSSFYQGLRSGDFVYRMYCFTKD
jgi:hypothetical protein